MSWWQRLWHRRRMEEQLDKELRFHLRPTHRRSDRAGAASPEEARREARLALGGPEQVKEQCRDARGTRWLEDFWQDFRYALRTLRQRPGFAAVALLTLALGSGATTVMFTVINGVLLKPLPFPEPGRLVRCTDTRKRGTWLCTASRILRTWTSWIASASRSLDMAGWIYNGHYERARRRRARGEFETSANLFSVFGVPLFRGRAFLPEEDRQGGAPVAILGYSLWQRQFAGNPSAIGASLVLDGKRYTIVGIAPPGFAAGRRRSRCVYADGAKHASRTCKTAGPHPVTTMARLRPGVDAGAGAGGIGPDRPPSGEQYPEVQ